MLQSCPDQWTGPGSTCLIAFGRYRLDPDAARLWKGDQVVPLQPRPLAVLQYLVVRAGTVVGRDELIGALWGGTHVTRAVLKVAVRAIREALEDDVSSPRYIETVGSEGYRFVGDGAARVEAASSGAMPAPSEPMVGRLEDLAALGTAFDRAMGGARQIVFVTGEAGIGKTTLIDRFVEDVRREAGTRIASGQCLEHHGEGEAYLPFLEAIGSLVRIDDAGEIAAIVRRHAPTWASELSGVGTDGRRRPAGRTTTTMPGRMLREMADALEALTQGRSLVLVLEDLQWSDRSTVDLIGCIARRRPAARLMLIGSFRPVEVIVHQHALRAVKQELRASGLCQELVLEPLSFADVAAYLDARFGAQAPNEGRRLAERIHDRTEGNALFMVNVVDDLVTSGLLVSRNGRWQLEGSVEQATDRVPTGLREQIERRLESLAPEARRALEVASVAGEEFSVAAVAAGLGDDVDDVEDVCESLASQGIMIADTGIAEWPDGSLSGRYRFLHALYRRVLYDAVGESRRARLHRTVGLREEEALGDRAAEHAPQLAMHFTRGRDHARALRYHELAADAALDRHAAHEAVAHFAAALDELTYAPEGDRAERELGLVVATATLLMAVRGYAASETEHAFDRARALCEASPPNPQLYAVLRGLVSYHHVRAELTQARELGDLLLRHAAGHPDDLVLRVQAHYAQGATLFHMGAFEPARAHLEAALADYDPAAHREHMRVYGGYDPGVASSLWLAWSLALLGRLDEAAARDREGLELARRLGDPFSLAWAHHAVGVSHQVFGDWAASEAASVEAARLAAEHGFPHVLGMATANQGWALVMQGKAAIGISTLRDGVATVAATGAALVRPQYLGMLAAADALEGDRQGAERRFDDGLAEVERTGERLHEVGLLIGKSHLLATAGAAQSGDDAKAAERCLQRALDVARTQGARLLELRAAIALARHWRKRGRAAAGRTLLASAHAFFKDAGPLAPEIAAARRLLAEPQ